jgi:hypothetical protein
MTPGMLQKDLQKNAKDYHPVSTLQLHYFFDAFQPDSCHERDGNYYETATNKNLLGKKKMLDVILTLHHPYFQIHN